jgi:RNA polymerase sigma-70 factor (ECF subfamily)
LATERLADLYEAHFGAVFRQCLAHLKDREDAADAAQDVFAKAARVGTAPGPDERSRAWLLTVARNHCVDLLRRRHRLSGALLRLEPDSDRTADPERTTIDRHLVQAVLEPMTPRDRQLLWESAVERRPLQDIAADLRLSYVATAQALRRARQRAGAIAARVAAVFGIIGRRRGTSALPGAREALLAGVVPLLVISSQSSLDQGAMRSAPPTASSRLSGGTITTPGGVVRSHELAHYPEAAGPSVPASQAVPLQPAAALVSVAALPSVDPPGGALKTVLLVASRLPAPLPGAPPTVAVSQAQIALGPGGLPLAR